MPKIFGRLLYGSKFHRLRQSRGQQGIGISAAGMYGLLTTGKPVRIITRTGDKKPAHQFELVIDTKTNEPRVTRDDDGRVGQARTARASRSSSRAPTAAGSSRSTRTSGRSALANPHAQHRVPAAERRGANGASAASPRVTKELPPETAEIKPHPYGVELGVLMQMFRDTEARNLRGCLHGDFSRVCAQHRGRDLRDART